MLQRLYFICKIKRRMKNYFIILIFFFTGALLAQNVVVTASVVSEDGTAIPLVNVYSKKSSNGCISDSNGNFSIRLVRKNQILRLSHVGYKTLEQKMILKNLEGDSLHYTFVLEKNVETLDELELSDGVISRAYNKPKIRILDFDFYDDGFIMLIAEENAYKLRWIGPNEELIYDISLAQHPKDLYRDCYDNFYVVYRATVEQVFVSKEKRWLEKTCTMVDFNAKIKACVVALEEYVYVREYSQHNQGVQYYKWDEKQQEVSLFSTIFDEYGYANAAGEMAYINSLGGLESLNGVGGVKISLRTAHKIENSYEFYKNILAKPEYQPLLKLKNELFLCNHITDTVYVYNFDGSPKRSFPINYHQQKGWKEVIVDATGESFFARCKRNGMAYILEVDINTGAIIGTTQLKQHVFPTIIRIKDHIAYYLYKDEGYFTETNIYQQNLH